MKKFFLCIFICLSVCGAAFPVAPDIEDKMKALTVKAAEVVTEGALSLNTTADAYIGKILPSVPPHFYNSFSLTTSLLDAKLLGDAFNSLSSGTGVSIDMPVYYIPLPTYGISTRLGGFFLPFDLGFAVAFALPATGLDMSLQDYNLSGNFVSLAFDLRYAVLQGRGYAPKISLGLGYAYTSNKYEITMKDVKGNATVGVNLQTESIYLQAQISKQFAFFIPSLGIKAALTKSGNSYYYELTGSTSNNNTGSGKVSNNFEIANIQPQLFVGLGFMIPHGHITLAGSWNIRNNLWNVSLHTGYRL